MSSSSQNNHDAEVFWYQWEAFSEEPALTNLPFLYFSMDFLSWNLLCLGVVLSCAAPWPLRVHMERCTPISGSHTLCWCSLFTVHFKYGFYQFDCQWEFLLTVYSTGCLLLFTCFFWIYICVCLYLIWVSYCPELLYDSLESRNHFLLIILNNGHNKFLNVPLILI